MLFEKLKNNFKEFKNTLTDFVANKMVKGIFLSALVGVLSMSSAYSYASDITDFNDRVESSFNMETAKSGNVKKSNTGVAIDNISQLKKGDFNQRSLLSLFNGSGYFNKDLNYVRDGKIQPYLDTYARNISRLRNVYHNTPVVLGIGLDGRYPTVSGAKDFFNEHKFELQRSFEDIQKSGEAKFKERYANVDIEGITNIEERNKYIELYRNYIQLEFMKDVAYQMLRLIDPSTGKSDNVVNLKNYENEKDGKNVNVLDMISAQVLAVNALKNSFVYQDYLSAKQEYDKMKYDPNRKYYQQPQSPSSDGTYGIEQTSTNIVHIAEQIIKISELVTSKDGQLLMEVEDKKRTTVSELFKKSALEVINDYNNKINISPGYNEDNTPRSGYRTVNYIPAKFSR